MNRQTGLVRNAIIFDLTWHHWSLKAIESGSRRDSIRSVGTDGRHLIPAPHDAAHQSWSPQSCRVPKERNSSGKRCDPRRPRRPIECSPQMALTAPSHKVFDVMGDLDTAES